MKAGRLREVIDLYREVTEVDPDYGSESVDFVKCMTTRADVIYSNGSESISNETVVNSQAVVFWIRFREGITETMQIEWRGCRYSIESIEDNRRRRLLKLSSSKILN